MNERDLLGSIRSLTVKREPCYLGKDQSCLKPTEDAEKEEERFFCQLLLDRKAYAGKRDFFFSFPHPFRWRKLSGEKLRMSE